MTPQPSSPALLKGASVGKLTKAQRRILEQAVLALDNPSKRRGTWILVHGGRSRPAIVALVNMGLARYTYEGQGINKRSLYEVEATDAGRAALSNQKTGEA